MSSSDAMQSESDASRETDADRLVTAAMESYLRELEAGRKPDQEEFLAKFPEIADALEEHLQGLRPSRWAR